MKTIDSDKILVRLSQLELGVAQPFSTCEELAEKVADLMELEPEHASVCLRFVSDVYDHAGESQLGLAIETCFLFHLGNRIFAAAEREALLAQLPRNLHDALMHQMDSTGP